MLFSAVIVPCRAGDWPHWRGPHRDGLSDEPSGAQSPAWNDAAPLWQAELGEGSTSPIVVAGRVYCLGWRDGRDTLHCLDAPTGRELWKQSYPCPQYGRRATGDEGLYSGPTSTPEFDLQTQRLFTLSTDGDLQCWDPAHEGRRLWKLNLYDSFDVPRRPRHGRSGLRDYGYTTAPLAWGNWVIVEVGDDEGTLMAFDQRTGRRIWASECRDPAGHAGGLVPLTVEGVPCVASFNYRGLLVARLDAGHEGQTIATHEWTTDFANNIATPAVSGNSILITSEYNHRAICRLDISLAGAKKIWEQPFASKVGSPIIHNGRVYWAWQQLRCLDFATGDPLWSGGAFGDAGSCILTPDDKLIVWGDRGKLALVDAARSAPSTYRESAVRGGLARSDAWPHVVLAGGRLFCKDRQGRLIVFALTAG
ncbi:MAG TPA: PQQ-binding-like beta-propeller repeat protein [Planctomycetaceae bacterium]|nr:PQQ-binding-like beta-propeller repeat protein [Planctomycetaceae bacterium]